MRPERILKTDILGDLVLGPQVVQSPSLHRIILPRFVARSRHFQCSDLCWKPSIKNRTYTYMYDLFDMKPPYLFQSHSDCLVCADVKVAVVFELLHLCPTPRSGLSVGADPIECHGAQPCLAKFHKRVEVHTPRHLSTRGHF